MRQASVLMGESVKTSHVPGAEFLVVGIGASAGGLDACRKLIEAMPPATGMAFILVQHLDPTHESMMVDLLKGHTALTVSQAVDGIAVAPEHLYIIQPGTYLSIENRVLRVSAPQARHGARLPFDFLLHSLAKDCGTRAACIVLSGTGGDGSAGVPDIARNGGLVIAQAPEEAPYDGMPRSAIQTGAVSAVLRTAAMPAALIAFARQSPQAPGADAATGPAEIIALLRTTTDYDFSLYKPGTLQRRIERRMGLAAIGSRDFAAYLAMLKEDADERTRLAKDLLINVTSFFRDAKVFAHLAEITIPEMVRNHQGSDPIRLWVAGCSTGEETYSLAILFREAIAAAGRPVKLQIFASDVDADAITAAREGVYPESIAAELSPELLARYFHHEDDQYRVTSELRAAVVFTVHDLLNDPPFSRIDMVSCRNLFIYLRPEAQTRVTAMFHFALREGGILLLGNAETISGGDGNFEVAAKLERIYRHTGQTRPGSLALSLKPAALSRLLPHAYPSPAAARAFSPDDLCRRLVLDTYAPASVLIDREFEILYTLGPTSRYLAIASGQPSHNLLEMVRKPWRAKLRAAVQSASDSRQSTRFPGGQVSVDGVATAVSIEVVPVAAEGKDVLLVSFVERPAEAPTAATAPAGAAPNPPRVAELEQELEASRAELQGAIHNLEILNQEQKAVNEEALSVNEAYQSTNEELLTSKEELQSLNEELTALNSQLQEPLERQRLTSNDLQNVLYSTDIATVFLDTALNIRLFTPATQSLFHIIPGDIGRPLADLNPLAADKALLPDCASVLKTSIPIEREIAAQGGAWFIRRVLPYRTHEQGVDGIVITFTDITERRRIADALEAAKAEAEQANRAKSRFLAAVSHDLRQPLQTLSLLQGLLADNAADEKAATLVARLETTIAAMAEMLNTLLDINKIESGTVTPALSEFPVGSLLHRLWDEYRYHTATTPVSLRFVPCGALVRSDPVLLEQILRNLLSNAVKYTRAGKILLGCRHHGGQLSVEIWDTGIGIPDSQIEAIFEEYHQVDNSARDRSRGLGLGLAIVKRLGNLLGHTVRARSSHGKGSVFSILMPMAARGSAHALASPPPEEKLASAPARNRILLTEDDPEISELLALTLTNLGYHVTAAQDGAGARAMVKAGGLPPDLIIADFNLPGGQNGLDLTTALRAQLNRPVPAIIIIGDTSAATAHAIAKENCLQLSKPVAMREMARLIRTILAEAPPNPVGPEGPAIFVVDDDEAIRALLRSVLEADGQTVLDFAGAEAFLSAFQPGHADCLVIDAYLPGMSGIGLVQALRRAGHDLPAIMITGKSDVAIAIAAMKAGAADFIEKPVNRENLLASVHRALERSRDSAKRAQWHADARNRIASLTPRQRDIMARVLAGQPSKNIAADLGINQRTVENHRAEIMKRTAAKSIPALARLAIAAAEGGEG